ncbi:MAG: PIN domain-containing protein [Bacteroidota bacterium]
MSENIQRVFLDTSFFIRLFKTDDPDHTNAKIYFTRFRDQNAMLFLSTIVAAEYGIKGNIDKLPFRFLQVVPFNISHAQKTALLARNAFEKRQKGILQLEKRVVIPNDTKILAQAEEVGTDLFIARDDNCEKVYRSMKEDGLITFSYLDLRTPPSTFFSELF